MYPGVPKTVITLTLEIFINLRFFYLHFLVSVYIAIFSIHHTFTYSTVGVRGWTTPAPRVVCCCAPFRVALVECGWWFWCVPCARPQTRPDPPKDTITRGLRDTPYVWIFDPCGDAGLLHALHYAHTLLIHMHGAPYRSQAHVIARGTACVSPRVPHDWHCTSDWSTDSGGVNLRSRCESEIQV